MSSESPLFCPWTCPPLDGVSPTGVQSDVGLLCAGVIGPPSVKARERVFADSSGACRQRFGHRSPVDGPVAPLPWFDNRGPPAKELACARLYPRWVYCARCPWCLLEHLPFLCPRLLRLTGFALETRRPEIVPLLKLTSPANSFRKSWYGLSPELW